MFDQSRQPFRPGPHEIKCKVISHPVKCRTDQGLDLRLPNNVLWRSLCRRSLTPTPTPTPQHTTHTPGDTPDRHADQTSGNLRLGTLCRQFNNEDQTWNPVVCELQRRIASSTSTLSLCPVFLACPVVEQMPGGGLRMALSLPFES